ncbi:MAG: glycosyl hydrolase, partial [Verrucomicrobiota bacterium]
TDAFLVRIDGQVYGVFGPQGMTISLSPDGADINFGSNPKGWLAIGVLPDPKMANLLRPAAGAIPRDSIYSWKYDPAKGMVSTTFELVTEALRRDAGEPLQGWIPHHFRAAKYDMKPVGTPFQTPRGLLLLSQGKIAHIDWTFPGVLPFYPTPKVVSSEKNPFDPARMSEYLSKFGEARKKDGDKIGDTYWGGKKIQKAAQYAALATRLNDPTAKELHDVVLGNLADYFTFTGPGDKYYFARYPKWGALIGFPPSYGSEFFTDNHFHYGYFTTSAGILGAIDPDFIKDYGPMARLVARQYANWDRNDKELPFLRTFDPWNGHSYAGGSSSRDGNNQESTSESMNSWGGLVLLGGAMDDKEMTACGAMGYSVECVAIRCYWNNYYGWKDGPTASDWPSTYLRAIVGIMGDSGAVFGTFFSGDPQHVFGIQWLPDSPILCYLGFDPKFVRYQFDTLIKDLQAKGKTLEQVGGDWGSLILGYLAFGEPESVAAQLDDLWKSNSPIARESEETGIVYFMTHSAVQNGTVAWDWHTSIPTSTVFRTGTKINAAIWNPENKPVQVQVMHGSTVAKTITVPARSLETVSGL